MKSSDAIIKCLEKENVEFIFGYPGGAVLPLYESLRNSKINHILVRHEQSAVHIASGYSRSSNKVGVCIATSGPGATNLITGIATAYMDSIPLIIITGQVKSTSIGKDVFQEADIIGATESFTKHNYLIKNAKDIPKIIKEAFYIASTGRKGPVLIDIPVDVQNELIKFYYPTDLDIKGYNPTYSGHIGQIKRAIRMIKKSSKPVICAGGGIILSKCEKELEQFAQKLNIPVVHTLMGKGAISSKSSNYYGMVGSHGNSYSNDIILKSDLVIIIGARITDRASSHFNLLEDKNIIHIDIDPAEVGKNLDTNIPIIGDAKNILQKLNLMNINIHIKKWIEEISQLKQSSSGNVEITSHVNPIKAITYLSSIADDQTILTADVGQNQIWAARNFELFGERQFLTSGGLGTMGYSLPASIGAKLSMPNKTVICVVGDSGIQMCLSELGTITDNDLKIIIILFNNNKLGMVRELQDNAFGRGCNHGVEFKFNPDFVKISNAYGINAYSVTNNDDFNSLLTDVLAKNEACLIECKVNPSFNTL